MESTAALKRNPVQTRGSYICQKNHPLFKHRSTCSLGMVLGLLMMSMKVNWQLLSSTSHGGRYLSFMVILVSVYCLLVVFSKRIVKNIYHQTRITFGIRSSNNYWQKKWRKYDNSKTLKGNYKLWARFFPSDHSCTFVGFAALLRVKYSRVRKRGR